MRDEYPDPIWFLVWILVGQLILATFLVAGFHFGFVK